MNLTLNIEVSADTQEAVAQIGDLNERVAWFLKEQAALERRRAERQNAEDRALAAAIVQDAQAAQSCDVPREEVAERLLSRLRVHQLSGFPISSGDGQTLSDRDFTRAIEVDLDDPLKVEMFTSEEFENARE